LQTERKADGSTVATSFKTVARGPAIYLAICLAGVLLAAGLGKTVAAAAAADDAGKMTFEANCSVCHDLDGSGDTPIGMSLEIPDLRSDEVQKLSDEELIAIVTNGKDPMPSFKGKLTADEIKGVIAYVRTFAKKK
jgi:cytochrome c6